MAMLWGQWRQVGGTRDMKTHGYLFDRRSIVFCIGEYI